MAARAQLGIVVFGDVIASRELARSAAWLRSLRKELDSAYSDNRLAPFEFTQGDELQGLLDLSADPFEAVIRAAVREDRLPMRWVIVGGTAEPGRGPATQRSGLGFVAARALVAAARRRRDLVAAQTGDEAADGLLADVAPVLGRLLAELTARQRSIARLLLIEELSQAEAARTLGIRPPTVSVAADRARVREIGRLWDASRALFGAGIVAASDNPGPGDNR